MRPTSKKIIRAAGIAAATAGLASLSAYVTASCFLRIALDRKIPPAVQSAEKFISGVGKNRGISEFMAAVNAADEKLAARENEVVEITAHDGEKLVGHWFPHEDPRRVIISFHGWRSSWSRDFGMSFDSWQESGCSSLIVEQRGQNNSGGDYMGFGLTERFDCLDWIDWVTRRCGSELPIYLCGVSMGATTVLMATGLELPENVHGVIADCGFTSPQAIWKHIANDNLHMPYGLQGAMADAIMRRKIQVESSAYSTIDALKTSRVPVIFIHGTEDHFVPVSMTYENYMACAAPRRLFIVPGASHGESYYLDRAGYEAAVRDFWREFD